MTNGSLTVTDLATRFRLQQALSWTSAARTFAGKHPETDEKVAVKILALADQAHVERLQTRFESTASILAGLSHPALPDLLDHGVSERNEAFLVTRWFPGAKLSELELDPGDLLYVVLQVTEALESLALHGLVHLGVAADNVLVMPDMQAQLTGWGSSLLNVDWQSGPGLSLSVTNPHTAPELRRSGGKADALWRADLFSLASMTAELLGAIIEDSGQSTQVKFPGELSRQISGPEALRSTLEQCLAQDPDQRPDAYSSLTKAIQRAVPRDRRQQVAATQPMPPLRLEPLPSGSSTGKVGADTQRMPPLPPVPQPEQEEGAESESGSGSPESADTGVHAIRQETGAFLLPKSSSDEGAEELFEASELADFLNEESVAEVLPPDLEPEPPADSEGEDATASQEVKDNTTAEIKVPVHAVSEGSETDETSPAAEQDTEAAPDSSEAATEFVSPDKLQEMVAAASKSADPEPAPHEAATKVASSGRVRELVEAAEQLARQDSEGSAEAATKLVGPEKLSEMVAEARSREDAEAADPDEGGAATELVSPERLREMVESAEANALDEAGASGEGEPEEPAETAAPSAASAPPPAEKDAPAPDESSDGDVVGAASPASTVVASSDEVREMLARAQEEAQSDGSAVSVQDASQASAPAPASAATRSEPDAPQSPETSRTVPRWAIAAAALFGLVLVATLVAGLLRRDPPPEPAPAAPVISEPVATEPPPPDLDPEMEQALILLGDGDWDEARPLITALQERAEAGELSPADLEALQSAAETLTLGYGEQVARLLQESLEQLDVNGMRSALRGGSNAAEALRRRPGGEDLLRRARTLLRAVDSFRSALDRGEGTEALERSLELRSIEPSLAERFRAVERSQSQIEDRVVGLMDSGSYGEARLELERAERVTNLSTSLAALKERVVQAMREESAVGDLIAQAEEFSRQDRPHLGLDVLQPANIPATQRGRANELRTRLERQLERLDADAPVIEFLDEAELKKDAPFDIRLRVSDDYEVSEVRVQVRTEGAPRARPVAVRALGGEEYVAQVPESVHDGKPLEFWAAAVDRSGHSGRLGSEEQPIEVKRRRWFQVFRRRGDG